MATYAASRVGSPYVWGATGPSRFDCSGLVVWSYKAAKAPLPEGVRVSQQMWSMGRRVSRASLRRGDLVFTWAADGSHVGVYLGKGRYVHAPAPGRRVTNAALPTGSGFIRAVRI